MDVVATLDAPCPPEVLFAEVEDLATYPEWLTIVPRAERDDRGGAGPGPGQGRKPGPGEGGWFGEGGGEGPGPGEGDGGLGEEAWVVDLRGRLGPLARSKRLRMVRTVLDAPHHVRFERRELHGRSQSPWVLDAQVEPTAGGSRLSMRLHYGGSFGDQILERMLHGEIERSRPRLLARVARPA